LTAKQKKILSYLIKACVLILTAIFVYKKLSNNANLKNFADLINRLNPLYVWISLAVVFLLMLLNWFVESLKWKFLIKKIEKISLWRALESVFCGLTWAVFTPNRIGEYGGRVFFLTNKKRIQGIVAMSVGHIAQMVITNIAGAIAVLWFLMKFQEIDFWLFFSLAFLVSVFCLFFVVFYFNIHWLDSLVAKVSFLKKISGFFGVLRSYSHAELWKVMLFSLLRFAVFTSQYLLVMKLLIPEAPVYQSALLVFILFFVQSALPSLDLFDFGVRSMTAAYFFSYVTNQEVAVMAAAALIWLVNLIIPAIMGAFFVFKLKFFGTHY